MSVNRDIDAEHYKQTLASVLPVQYEPGSLADRLLIQGREEGRKEGREEIKLVVAGQIQLLEELLGDTLTTDAELQSTGLDALTMQLADLQQRLRDRPS